MFARRSAARILGRWLAIFPLIFRTADVEAGSSIFITQLPAYGSTNLLSGTASDASPADWRVAAFIYVPGTGGWWSKPACPGQPLTLIQPDGGWSANITTGGSDANATRIAALLVRADYNQPCVLGIPFLPTNVLSQASAAAIVTRPIPGVRQIHFSGYDWWVKTAAGPVGPGPNYFSDSTNNVWLDAQGALHLRITNRSNSWQCAEVVSARTFGYGSYRFELNSPVDNLDPNAVLGLFTWSDDPAFAHREIDIEGSRWGNASDTNNAQYVVQPFDIPGHLVRLKVPPGQVLSTHSFIWNSSGVSYQSLRGGYAPNPDPTNQIRGWNYALSTPQTGDENVRLNLWLYNGAAPTDHQETEIVLTSFQFVPPGPPQPATLMDLQKPTNGPFRFALHGTVDRRYQVQACADLSNWQTLAGILATNNVVDFLDADSVNLDTRFYRVLSLP